MHVAVRERGIAVHEGLAVLVRLHRRHAIERRVFVHVHRRWLLPWLRLRVAMWWCPCGSTRLSRRIRHRRRRGGREGGGGRKGIAALIAATVSAAALSAAALAAATVATTHIPTALTAATHGTTALTRGMS